MAVNNNKHAAAEGDVFARLVALHAKVLRHQNVSVREVRAAAHGKPPVRRLGPLLPLPVALLAIIMSCSAVLTSLMAHDSMLAKHTWETRCALQNNFLVMEATRPEADCRMCSGVSGAEELPPHVTREQFARLAYASRPVVVRGATANWTAMEVFGFDFFRALYEGTRGAYDAVEQECQFFPFNTEFTSLRQVFSMPAARARREHGHKPWYIGWSNCDPRVAALLRTHYTRPPFLPEHADASAIDWIFMGGAGPGASLHLDYVSRPSWQAQVSGSKTWRLLPPPECEHACRGFSVTVNTGDIVLIDTNQWYHDTTVNPGPLSITIGSEYG